MKRYFFLLILCSLLIYSNFNIAQSAKSISTTTTTVNGKTTTTTDSVVNGKTYSSTTSISGPAYAVAYSGNAADDTTNWKWREISKDFNISSNAAIFLESAYRNIEIKTWDQPTVRIVAKTGYKEDKEANTSFDEIFEKAGVKIKSNVDAFEILGANNTRTYSYSINYPHFNANNLEFKDGYNTTIINMDTITMFGNPTFTYTGDSIEVSNNDNEQLIRVFTQKNKDEKGNLTIDGKTKKNLELKKREEEKKLKIIALTKKMESLSKKLAALNFNKIGENNAEITNLNKEISKLSNQIAYQSIENRFFLKADTSKTKWNIQKPTILKLIRPNSGMNSKITNATSLEMKNTLKWTIYIPKNHKISIDSKYGNVALQNDIENAKIISKYGNIDTKNITNLVVRNEYGNVYTGNIQKGDVEIRTGKLKMQNVNDISIDSKNANIDLDEVGNIKVTSSNDNYDINSVQDLSANKNYGSFRLTTLKGKMNFTGTNADINIRTIAPSTTNIDINNKYAKIALPFFDIKNYNVVVNGISNNSYDNFNKKENGNSGFSATGGNGLNLITNIKCDNCQLDFK